MPQIFPQRMTRVTESDFVVFLVGMRLNPWWKVHTWLPLAFAMRRMLQELAANWLAWGWFNQAVRGASGDAGIWHETYKVAAGACEAVYASMHHSRLAMAGAPGSVGGAREGATERLVAGAAA